MGGAVGPVLAAAVSNTGGLGMLVLRRANPEMMRKQIRDTRALTAKPFGVNLNLEFPQEERLAICLEANPRSFCLGGLKVVSIKQPGS
jgi:NAD(P)H-dependent flavin oxidoreductase YrpB (nitropropane dioxygenase family)